MHRGASQAAVHRVAKSGTRLSHEHFPFHFRRARGAMTAPRKGAGRGADDPGPRTQAWDPCDRRAGESLKPGDQGHPAEHRWRKIRMEG